MKTGIHTDFKSSLKTFYTISKGLSVFGLNFRLNEGINFYNRIKTAGLNLSRYQKKVPTSQTLDMTLEPWAFHEKST